MKIGEHLYFAPAIKFSQVDMNGNELAEQLRSRILGFYLEPARLLLERRHAFAAGVMLVVTIDALARLETGNPSVCERFEKWCTDYLPSCKAPEISRQFYENFRNGLVHETRIKDGAEFSLEAKETFEEKGEILSCNPSPLYEEVESAFTDYVESLKTDSAKLLFLRERIAEDFAFELRP